MTAIKIKSGRIVVTGSNRKGSYSLSIGGIRYLKEANLELPPDVLAMEEAALSRPPSLDLSSEPFKTQPWNKQLGAISFAIQKKRLGIFFEPGCGKTLTAIYSIEYLLRRNLVRFPVIVIPLSITRTWMREWEKHSTCSQVVTFKSVASLKKNLAQWDKMPPNTALLVNYERLKTALPDLIANKPDIVVFDESTKIKSIKAERTRAAASLSKQAEFSIVMTGTPAIERLSDLFGQYYVLDPIYFGRFRFAFERRYCVMGGWMGKQIVGYQREDEIREILEASSISAQKKDVAELPPKIYEERFCKMDPEQAKLYKKLSKEYLVEFGDSKIDIKNAINRITKLQEIAGGFVILNCRACNRTRKIPTGVLCAKCDDGGEHELSICSAFIRCRSCQDGTTTVRLGRAKINATLEVLDELSSHTACVIWCKYREEIAMLKEAISPLRQTYVMAGGLTQDEQSRVEETFRADAIGGKGAVWIVQVQTGGLGLQLEYVSHTIVYSNPFEGLYRLQLEDRFHRPGQRNPVTIYEILAQYTCDEKIMRVVKAKKLLSDWIIERRGNLAELMAGAA